MTKDSFRISPRAATYLQASVPAVLLCMLVQSCAFMHKAAPPPAEPEEGEHLSVLLDADPTDGPAPLTVHFKPNTFERTDITEFHWDFGDGSKSDKRAPTHTYTKPGDYTAKVTAVSPTGFSDWSWQDITVEGPDDESDE
jgi:hypothetical protein